MVPNQDNREKYFEYKGRKSKLKKYMRFLLKKFNHYSGFLDSFEGLRTKFWLKKLSVKIDTKQTR